MILIGDVRNSSPAFSGSPFGFANKRVFGIDFHSLPKLSLVNLDTKKPLSQITDPYIVGGR